MVKKAIKYG